MVEKRDDSVDCNDEKEEQKHDTRNKIKEKKKKNDFFNKWSRGTFSWCHVSPLTEKTQKDLTDLQTPQFKD